MAVIGREAARAPLTSADINDGIITADDLIDTLDLSGKTITLGALSATGNISFGDNDKAVFGAGSDLQIYHDGSNSYVKDAGTGNLNVQGNHLSLEDSTGTRFFLGLQGGETRIYNQGNEKLAATATGIDVTGTVTADGLTVDGDNSTFNSVNANAVVLQRNGGSDLNVAIHFNQTTADTYLGTDSDNSLVVGRALNLGVSRTAKFDQNGDISFYEDTGTTPKFFWDASAEFLGVGTVTPSQTIEARSATQAVIRVRSDAGSITDFGSDATGTYWKNFTAASNTYRWLQDDGTENMRIDSSGNVGIGTSTINERLVLGSADSGSNFLQITNSTTTAANDRGLYVGIDANENARIIQRENADMFFSTNNAEVMTLDANGRLFVGATTGVGNDRVLIATDSSGTYSQCLNLKDTNASANGNYFLVVRKSDDTYVGALRRSGTDNAMLIEGNSYLNFATASAANAMRLDASGNLLVGKASNTFSISGFSANANGMSATRSAGPCVQINRTTSDGDIAEFYKDGTIVGSIGTAGGGFYLGNAASLAYANIRFTNNEVFPCQSDAGNNDDAIDLGKSNSRWRDIYAGNATIITSDVNEKQDIAELDEAERRVAVACKGLLRKFRWISSVEEKGDDARIHFGIIAQDLQAAFEAEGLDAGRYAMFIHSTWTDEETGEERSRMGVRYSELLAFIIAAL